MKARRQAALIAVDLEEALWGQNMNKLELILLLSKAASQMHNPTHSWTAGEMHRFGGRQQVDGG